MRFHFIDVMMSDLNNFETSFFTSMAAYRVCLIDINKLFLINPEPDSMQININELFIYVSLFHKVLTPGFKLNITDISNINHHSARRFYI